RRGVAATAPWLASGPGSLTRALGLSLRDNGADLARGALVIIPPARARDFTVARGRRVGITRSTELPLRFWIAGHPSVSVGPRSRIATRRTRAHPSGGRDS